MSVRRRLTILSISSAMIALSVVPGALAQPDPAVSGVCYATLGNNASSPGALITVNTATGAGAVVGATGIVGGLSDPGVPALAIKSTGEMYATDIGPSSKLYRVDATTGAATLVAPTTLSSVTAIAFDGADVLWATDNLGNLHIVNDATGASTLVGSTGAFIKGLAFDPTDGILWGSDASGDVYKIDVHTADTTHVGNTGLPATPDIHFDDAGNLYGSSGGGLANNNLIAIDKANGQGAVIGPIGFASVAGMASRHDRIVPVALQAYDSYWTAGRVKLTWRLIDIEGVVSFDILRAAGTGLLVPIGEAAIDEYRGTFVFVDDAVEPGTTYRYHVFVFEDGSPVASFETSVTTPATVSSLDQNVPNPFNPATTIRFSIASKEHVQLMVYDVAGRRVATLVDERRPADIYKITWDGLNDSGERVASGVYFFRLRAGKFTRTKKMLLLK